MLTLLLALFFSANLGGSGQERPLLISTTAAANMLGISLRHLLKLAESGEVRTIKLGRRRMVVVAGLQEMITKRLDDAS